MSAQDFKRITVRDIRKMIKELGLLQKNPKLKGYSYKKKNVLIDQLVEMNLNPEEIGKRKKQPRVMSQAQKKALADGRMRKKNKKNDIVKNMDDPVRVVIDVSKEQINTRPIARKNGTFTIVHLTKKGQVQDGPVFKSLDSALKEFNKIIQNKKYKKNFIIEVDSDGAQEIVRSSDNTRLNMSSKKRENFKRKTKKQNINMNIGAY